MKRILLKLVVCSLVTVLPAATWAQVNFKFIKSPVPTWFNLALSGNGRVMAANYGGEIFRWSATGGFVDLGQGDELNSSIGISKNGSAIISGRLGQDGNTNPGLWTKSSGWLDLGHPKNGCTMDGSWGSGYGLNRNGTVAVGLAWYCPGAEGFKWTQRAGMLSLGHPAGASSRASAISADGSTIVGFAEDPAQGFRRPVIWSDGHVDFFAGRHMLGEATAVSSDGKFVAGQADDGSGVAHAFIHTQTEGMVSIGTLSGNDFDQSIANGVSDCGVVIGWSGDPFNGGINAFVWDSKHGIRSLRKVLQHMGAKIRSNVFITDALSISADGSTMVGTWQDSNFNQGAWMARFAKPLN